MDVLSSIGGAAASGAYLDPAPTPIAASAPSNAGGASVASAASAGASKAVTTFSPAVDDAPSPTPESIITDTKSLPLSVQYAPSAAPHIGGDGHFDRRA